MKLFGSLSELVSLVARKNSQAITLRPNQTVTYTAARDVQLPQENADQVILSRASTDQGSSRLQNKDLDAASVKFVDTSDTSKAAGFTTSGASSSTRLSIASVATTNRTVTMPDATTTLVGTDTTDTLSNKTLASPAVTTSASFSNQAAIKFFEQTGNGTNFVALEAPNAVTADTTFKLPNGDGSPNQVLQTDGSANLSWVSLPGSAGSTTTDLDSTNTTVNSGTTLFHPNLTIDTSTTYTVNGRLLSENQIINNGTLIVNGTSRIL
jgi:hypothetical protein